MIECNPTLGLVYALIKEGENVVYFCKDQFKKKIEKTGAVFNSYTDSRRNNIQGKMSFIDNKNFHSITSYLYL
ncbi:hypothetical protein [Clostridium akagii]|uniref:hypothetical protein n=1 Tax=Clostridium akagii TaxID=91623 RepID=UPI00047EA127|nr:hypothetical protein [Clostridium akagii]